jgi:two-component system LytT family sensor kinase
MKKGKENRTKVIWSGYKRKALVVLLIAAELIIGFLLKNELLLLGFLVLNTLFFYWVYHRLESRIQPANSLRQPDLSVKIAHETLPYLRRGLNEQNAEAIAKIIQQIAQVAAVSITDCEKQLAYIGAGCDRHHPGDKILTEATREVIRTSNYKIVQTQQELNCPLSDHCDCPLAAAVIVPLVCRGNVVGTFKLYETKDGNISSDLIRLAIGMGQILSLQVELAELDHQANLATEAKLDALQAQINPHFFFNVMNTIIATSRSNPNRARRLLIHLAEFFRRALKSKGALISIKEEMEFVNTYLVLEKARFGRKLKIRSEIPRDLNDAEVPRLSIQPLVENAVKHGITPLLTNGTVYIRWIVLNWKTAILNFWLRSWMMVWNRRRKTEGCSFTGVGSGNGVGLANVHARLQGLYGEDYGLKIQSELGEGTTVTMRLPYSRVIRSEAS